jgi:hypothetical protein
LLTTQLEKLLRIWWDLSLLAEFSESSVRNFSLDLITNKAGY